MRKWNRLAVYLLSIVVLCALSYVYSRKIGDELISQADADDLARIPVVEPAEEA